MGSMFQVLQDMYWCKELNSGQLKIGYWFRSTWSVMLLLHHIADLNHVQIFWGVSSLAPPCAVVATVDCIETS